MSKFIALLAVGAMIVGCSSGSSSSGNSGTLSGLWDLTETEDGLQDVVYLEFRSDSAFTFYDYEADSFGTGENCYGILSLPYESLGNSQYDIGGEVITAVINGDQLTITDSEGTFTFARLTGISSTDLNAC